jgi:hypothetical protein
MEQVAWLLQVIGFGVRVGPRNLIRGSDSGNERGLFGRLELRPYVASWRMVNIQATKMVSIHKLFQS